MYYNARSRNEYTHDGAAAGYTPGLTNHAPSILTVPAMTEDRTARYPNRFDVLDCLVQYIEIRIRNHFVPIDDISYAHVLDVIVFVAFR